MPPAVPVSRPLRLLLGDAGYWLLPGPSTGAHSRGLGSPAFVRACVWEVAIGDPLEQGTKGTEVQQRPL